MRRKLTLFSFVSSLLAAVTVTLPTAAIGATEAGQSRIDRQGIERTASKRAESAQQLHNDRCHGVESKVLKKELRRSPSPRSATQS